MAILKRLREGLRGPDARLTLIFALEGMLFQFSGSIKAFGNNLFATNLGATDTQIGLIQTVGCAVTVALLLPVGIISDRCRSAKTVPVCLLLPKGKAKSVQTELLLDPFVQAPVKAGDRIGKLRCLIGEEVVCETDVVSRDDVARIGWGGLFYRLLGGAVLKTGS